MAIEENGKEHQEETTEQRQERQKEEFQQRKKVIDHFTEIQKRIAAKRAYEKILKEQIDTINTEIASIGEKPSAEQEKRQRIWKQQVTLLQSAIEEQENEIAEQNKKIEKILKKWENAIGKQTLENINKTAAEYSEKRSDEIKKAADSRIKEMEQQAVEAVDTEILENNKKNFREENASKFRNIQASFEKEIGDAWGTLGDQFSEAEKFYNHHKGMFDSKYFSEVGKALHEYRKLVGKAENNQKLNDAETALLKAVEAYEAHVARKEKAGELNGERKERLKFVQELKENITAKNKRISEAKSNLDLVNNKRINEILEIESGFRFAKDETKNAELKRANAENKRKREEEEKKDHSKQEADDNEFMIWNEQLKKMMTEQEEVAYVKGFLANALKQELEQEKNSLDVEHFMETGEIYNEENPQKTSGLLRKFEFTHQVKIGKEDNEVEYKFKKAKIGEEGELQVEMFSANASSKIVLRSEHSEFFMENKHEKLKIERTSEKGIARIEDGIELNKKGFPIEAEGTLNRNIGVSYKETEVKVNYETENSKIDAKVKKTVGSLQSEAELEVSKDKIKAGIKSEANLVKAEANFKYKNDYVEVDAEAKGAIGVLEAKTNLKIEKDKVKIGAKAGLYAAKGKAKAGFRLLGVRIGLIGSVAFGLGMKAGIKYKKGSFSTSFGLIPVGFGANVELDVDYKHARMPDAYRKYRYKNFLYEQSDLKQMQKSYAWRKKNAKGPDTEENRPWFQAEKSLDAISVDALRKTRQCLYNALYCQEMAIQFKENEDSVNRYNERLKENVKAAEHYIDMIRKHAEERKKNYYDVPLGLIDDPERRQYLKEKCEAMDVIIETFGDKNIIDNLLDGTALKKLSDLQSDKVFCKYSEKYPEDLNVVMDGAKDEINKAINELEHEMTGIKRDTSGWMLKVRCRLSDEASKKIADNISENVSSLKDYDEYEEFAKKRDFSVKVSKDECKKIKDFMKTNAPANLETYVQNTVDQFTSAMKKPFDRCFVMDKFAMRHIVKIDELRQVYRRSELNQTSYPRGRMELAMELACTCAELKHYLQKVQNLSAEYDKHAEKEEEKKKKEEQGKIKVTGFIM